MWKNQTWKVIFAGVIYIASITGCAKNTGSTTLPVPAIQIPIQQTLTSKMMIPTQDDLETGKNEAEKIGTAGEADLSIDHLVAQIREDFNKRLYVNVEKIKVVKVDSADWPDTSLGCPHPGEDYSDIITPGFLIFIRAQGQLYQYHSEENGHLVLCDKDELFTDPFPVMPVAPHGKPPKCQWTPCP